MSILNLVMMNPNIPQETKDQIFSQTITAIEQGFKQEPVAKVAPVVAPVTITEPVAMSSFIEPVSTRTATNTATTTVYRAGTVYAKDGGYVFNKGDADYFSTKFSITGGKDYTTPAFMVADHRGQKNAPQEEFVDLSNQDIEGTLYIISKKNGVTLDERTYNFKVDGGVAQLY